MGPINTDASSHERQSMPQNRKVLVIGIDGATFDVIRPLIAEGKLPHMNALMNEGAHGGLLSTIPRLSPVAWTSFSTGATPGSHGVFNFVDIKPGTEYLAPVTSVRRQIKPLWKVASEMGKKSVVLNVCGTSPPDEFDGIMISGEPSPFHDSRRVSPPEAFDKLAARFGKRFLAPPRSRSKAAFLADLLQTVDLWRDVSLFLMPTIDWDLFVITFISSDTTQHFFWKDMEGGPGSDPAFRDAVYQVYERIDQAIGRLLEAVSNDTSVLIVSDHGFEPLYQSFSLPDWLAEKGYLVRTPNRMSRRLVSVKNLFQAMLRKAGVMGSLPPPLFLSGVDWSQTRAYDLGPAKALNVNLEGRETCGTVKPGAEYEQLVAELTSELMAMTLPDGQKPVKHVYRREDLYPKSRLSPDLLIDCVRGVGIRAGGDPMGVFKGLRRWGVTDWSGDHAEEGIFIVRGPDVVTGPISDARIIDVAPTIYHLLGLDVPESLDGKALTQALSESSAQAVHYADIDVREAEHAETEYNEEESDKVAQRLRDLGYLD